MVKYTLEIKQSAQNELDARDALVFKRINPRPIAGHHLLIGKVGEIDVRLARLEERSSK